MSIVVGTNSWVNIDEANEYFEGRLYSDSWEGASDSTKNKALLMSFKMMKSILIKDEYDEIPQEIKDGQCEYAIILLSKDVTRQDEYIVSSRSGETQVQYDVSLSAYSSVFSYANRVMKGYINTCLKVIR